MIKYGDIRAVGRITVLAALSWIVPVRYWASMSGSIARAITLLRPGRTKIRRARRCLIFENRFELAALDRMEELFLSHSYLAHLQGLREYRLGGWRSEIQVLGTDHIDAAIAAGRGVVLWIAGFAYSDLVAKKGLYEAGYRISHLSRPTHNISDTRFGIACLNPIVTQIEDRYLAERMLIYRDRDSGSVMELMRCRLAENRVISITVGDEAKHTISVDFLSTELPFATGPLHLARTSNALLLPVFTVMQENGSLIVNVEGPIIGDGGEEPYESVVRRYAERLEHYVLRYPDQWNALYGLREV